MSKGESVHSEFSVVIRSDKDDEPFGVITLRDLDRLADTPYTDSFLIPEPAGQLEGDSSSFSYRVIEETAPGQIIEVVETHHDGDNTIWSRYEATESSVSPISSRMFYFGYMFTAIPYAIGFALLLYAIAQFLKVKARNPESTTRVT